MERDLFLMQQRQKHTGWYFSEQWSGNFHQHEKEQEGERERGDLDQY